MKTRPLLCIASVLACGSVSADETCNSPYMSGLIKGQEHFIHVWTLGVEGLGDGSDKLVTIDVAPTSRTYGKVVHTLSVGERGEAHHMGFTDDRKQLWAGRSRATDLHVRRGHGPVEAHARADDRRSRQPTGYSGRTRSMHMPGRMLIGNLSNTKDSGGVTGIAQYNDHGGFVAKLRDAHRTTSAA